ncbi:MAG: 4'-phosphopantetheinyl transferase superfamily protein [Solirubrobacteraceae bacterium]|nr:4'-phosphopantetheinyl transferase superfamily protein [Patulibacter sp.]
MTDEAPADPTDPAHVDVWWARRSAVSELDWSVMSDLERERVQRRSPGVRERSVFARVLLRLALAERFGREPESFEVDWSRGPAVRDPGSTWLSLSHTGDLVAVCISDGGPIGLDLEVVDRDDDLDDTFRAGAFDHRERAMIAGFDGLGDLAALQLWTAKEAVLKASGDGLTRSPLQLHIAGIPDHPRLVRFEGRDQLVSRTVLRPLDLAGGAYVGSVAVLTTAPLALTVRDAAGLFAA